MLVLFLAQMKRSPGSLSRSPARTRAPKQSTGLFLCFALPFSNLFYILKKNKHKSACSFLGADEEIRTLETVVAVYTISNRAPSASSDTSAYKAE